MKRGFTLIELLAVIVILAIIALIATPIVVNIINDSKISSEKENAKLYVDTMEKTIVKENLKGKFDPKLCEIKNNKIICDKSTVNIDISKSVPDSGYVIFSEGKMKSSCLNFENNSFRYKDGNYEKSDFCEIPICISENGIGSTQLGTKYNCKVNDEKNFNFYVLDYDDNKKQVSLIMDSNICSNGEIATNENPCNIFWSNNKKNTTGPDKALSDMYNATKNWNNIPNVIMDYIVDNYDANYGYKSIITDEESLETTIKDREDTIKLTVGSIENPLKARLPEITELRNSGCAVSYAIPYGKPNQGKGSCPFWLADNLYYCSSCGAEYELNKNKNLSEITGYWTSTPYSSSNNEYYYLSMEGVVYAANSGYFKQGIRPVIELPLSRIN